MLTENRLRWILWRVIVNFVFFISIKNIKFKSVCTKIVNKSMQSTENHSILWDFVRMNCKKKVFVQPIRNIHKPSESNWFRCAVFLAFLNQFMAFFFIWFENETKYWRSTCGQISLNAPTGVFHCWRSLAAYLIRLSKQASASNVRFSWAECISQCLSFSVINPRR